MRGRKSIPDEVKILRGTDQPCRLSKSVEVDPIKEYIEKLPKNSPLKTARAKKIFIQKANQCISMRMLTELDIEQLSMYAFAIDQVYTAMEELKKGMFKEIYDENGRVLRYIENPYLKLFRDMSDLANRIGANFGFSPVNRQKLSIEKEKEENLIDELKKLI